MKMLGSFRFAPLLIATAAMAILLPILSDAGRAGWAAAVALPAVLLGGAIAVSGSGTRGRVLVALWAGIAVADLLSGHDDAWLGPVTRHALNAAYLGVVFVVILRDVVSAQQVDLDTILGSICGYLLIAEIFVALYLMVEGLAPGSFLQGGALLANGGITENPGGVLADLTYFSFVTLTTLGYGDVLPASAVARSLATLQAVAGQLYLTVLIAALVGIYIAGRNKAA